MSKKLIDSETGWKRLLESYGDDIETGAETPSSKKNKPKKIKHYNRSKAAAELEADNDPDLDRRKIDLNALIPEKDFRKAGFDVYKKKDYVSYTKGNHIHLSVSYDRKDNEIWMSGSYPVVFGKPRGGFGGLERFVDAREVGDTSLFEFSFLWNVGKFIKNIDVILKIKQIMLKKSKTEGIHRGLINDLSDISEMTTTANIPNVMNHAMTIRRAPILEPLEITREKLDKVEKKKKKYSAQFVDILDLMGEKK
jgi:hypothetical protein